MRLVLTAAPAEEPVTLDEAKTHCRIDSDADDDLVTALIISARRFIDNYIQGGLITQTWTAYFDWQDNFHCKRFIELPLQPVISIVSITSYNSANDSVVISADDYRLSGDRIVFNDDSNWLWIYDLRMFDCLEVAFDVGFGAAVGVPNDIKQSLLMLVAHWYETREANAPSGGAVPFGVSALLQSYRRFSL